MREGGPIAHDNDVDLTVLLEGSRSPRWSAAGSTFKATVAEAGPPQLDYEVVPRAHSKLVRCRRAERGRVPGLDPRRPAFAVAEHVRGTEAADLLPLEEREIRGSVVRVPRRPEAFLVEMYGHGWASPDPTHRFDWKAAK